MNNSVLNKAIINVIGIAIAITSFGYLQAASFDCAKTSTNVEKLICQDGWLSSGDDRLAIAYKNAMNAVSDKDSLKHQQRVWLTEIRNKCPDIYCLNTVYRNREIFLFRMEIEAKKTAGSVGRYNWVDNSFNEYGGGGYSSQDKYLCQEFNENLNAFPSANPMQCELKLKSELGFLPLEWKSLDIKKHENIIRDMERDNYEGNSIGMNKINDNSRWNEIFDSIKKNRNLKYVVLDINDDGKKENILHYSNNLDGSKNCDVYEKSFFDRSNGKYFITDLDFKNIINLNGGRGAPKAFQYPRSGDFFNYKDALYFVTMSGKKFSKEKNQFYSILRLSKVPDPHNAMGSSEKCVFHFVWP